MVDERLEQLGRKGRLEEDQVGRDEDLALVAEQLDRVGEDGRRVPRAGQ